MFNYQIQVSLSYLCHGQKCPKMAFLTPLKVPFRASGEKKMKKTDYPKSGNSEAIHTIISF